MGFEIFTRLIRALPKKHGDGNLNILFIHPSAPQGSSGYYLQALGEALSYMGHGCLMLGEKPGEGSKENVEWRRFQLYRGRLSRKTHRLISRFQPDVVVNVGIRVKPMLAALEVCQTYSLPLAQQAEDDDLNPFERYYPGDANLKLLTLLDKPNLSPKDIANFEAIIDWQLTARIWCGEATYRLVEPALRAACLHRAGFFSAIWYALADELSKSFSKPSIIIPPVADLERLQPSNMTQSQRNRILRRRGILEDRLTLFLPGVIYEYSQEFDVFLQAVSVASKKQPLNLVLSGKHRIDVSSVIDKYMSNTLQITDLGYTSDQEFRNIMCAADIICVPGSPGTFNRMRFPSRLTLAMALARPVLTYRDGLEERMVDGQDAILVESFDSDKWTLGIVRLFNETLREELSINARAFAERELASAPAARRLSIALLELVDRHRTGYQDKVPQFLSRRLDVHWDQHN